MTIATLRRNIAAFGLPVVLFIIQTSFVEFSR